MGEIGISYHDFYYELKWWEVKAIIRGYHARHHHSWEQARLIAYHARYCMGSKDPVPTPEKWLPFTWELKAAKIVSDAERQDLQAEMDAINQALDNGTQETPTMVNQQTDQGEPANSPRSNV